MIIAVSRTTSIQATGARHTQQVHTIAFSWLCLVLVIPSPVSSHPWYLLAHQVDSKFLKARKLSSCANMANTSTSWVLHHRQYWCTLIQTTEPLRWALRNNNHPMVRTIMFKTEYMLNSSNYPNCTLNSTRMGYICHVHGWFWLLTSYGVIGVSTSRLCS